MPTAMPARNFAAPTGKAAKRMSEMTGRDAQTIHRTLGARPDPKAPNGFRFYYGVKQTEIWDDVAHELVACAPFTPLLPASLVVVDECSMVDTALFLSLLRALRDDCRLLLVGDQHQLPSVGPGALLRDLHAFRRRARKSFRLLAAPCRAR